MHIGRESNQERESVKQWNFEKHHEHDMARDSTYNKLSSFLSSYMYDLCSLSRLTRVVTLTGYSLPKTYRFFSLMPF